VKDKTEMLKSPNPIRLNGKFSMYCGILLVFGLATLTAGLNAAVPFTPAAFTPSASESASDSLFSRSSAYAPPVQESPVPESLVPVDSPLTAADPLPLSTAVLEEPSDPAAEIIREGQELITEKNWPEAKSLLEDGIKKNPDQPRMKNLYLECRAHVEVEVRYHDRSYCTFLAETNKEEITYLSDAVLENIERWHVDAPDWGQLFHLGMKSFAVALTEDAFLRQNRVPNDIWDKLPKYGAEMVQYADRMGTNSKEQLKRNLFVVAESVQKNTRISGISVIMEILCGMVNSLDTYSAWLTSGQINDVFSLIDGHFVGLGVYIDTLASPDSLLVTKVIPRSPAEEVGLTAGDRIKTIDGSAAIGEEGAELLQGEEGSRVVLEIMTPDNSVRTVSIIRRAFDFPSVEEVNIVDNEAGGRVGTLKINTFQKSTVTEMREQLVQFQKAGVDSIVIDLRDNPGGLLDKAIELSNLFLENGTIVRTRGRQSEQVRRADAREVCSLPMVILIDENSASAAEIFAGAMQENGRAVVVGTTSYGKGTIQAIIQLENRQSDHLLAGLRLTTEKFYSPKGRAYSGVGVTPDIDLSGRYTAARPNPAADNGESAEPDETMERGIAEAQKLITRRRTTAEAVRGLGK